MNEIISGNCINLYYVEGNNWKKIAHSTVFGLTINLQYSQTKSKDDDDDFYGAHPQVLSWNLEGESLFSDDDDMLMSVLLTGEKLFISFGIIDEGQSTPPEYGYMGYCFLTSLEVSAPTGDKATYKYSLNGFSSLKYGQIAMPDPSQPIVFNSKETPTLEFESSEVEHEESDDYTLPNLINPLELPVRYKIMKMYT